ncbi:GNAT family N-acetyltransferase [Paenibacillus albiflavus]|uniref:GNAT family N-acetyltransferase n=1 Tax=Paenibacillus albiflavus TaxID=2545760 RepID=A0A4V2WP21_9BACL|nr:GNAT family N-acetyltransferase [Paenibacillus albiflavus]TCZ77702.1 GNAT family N-acetyltransferase [Paenibacillus albiflavus]
MCIRSFKLSDYGPATALLQRVLSEDCYDATIQAFARQLSWDTDLILIAEQDDEMVGIIIGTIDNAKGYVYRVAVTKEHRGLGIGERLTEALKQRFNIRQVNKIMVNMDSYNEVAIPFFESIGYQEVDFFRFTERLSIVKNLAY